jgi:glucose/arabinose dehydrogenase
MKRALLILLFASLAAHADEPRVTLRQVVTGLATPTSITHAADTRLFITEQTGRIRIYDRSILLTQPFLDLRPFISCCGERGLLSMAFHPRFRENGYFFVNYTDTRGDTVVARYTVSVDDPNRANPSSALVLLHITQPFANHNGGQLQFGPDGYLYIGMGDGGSQGDPSNNGQTTSALLGKLLRIDVDSASPYAIPPGNPFARGGGSPEVWAYGLRNPWRFSFDRETGDLWIADVGQNAWEEVDFQPATSIGGENYGWRRMEGTHCYNPSSSCQQPGLVLPVAEYSHSLGCSITGGYRYRGGAFPRMNGMYFYGDYCSGTVWGLTGSQSTGWQSRVVLASKQIITTFGEDVYGELYLGAQTGVIFRMVDEPTGTHRRAAGK